MIQNTVVLKQTELLGQQFTVYGTKEEPLFVAADVAAMIEHPNTSELIKLVDDEEKLTSTILRSGQGRKTWMLTENGLYEVLMQSRKPIAKEFKKGVKRILKDIRQNGGYIATTQEDTEETILAKALIIAQRTIEKQKARIETIAHEKEKLKAENNVLLPDANYTKEVFVWNLHGGMLQKCFWKEKILWSDGYFVCSIGEANPNTARKHIRLQG